MKYKNEFWDGLKTRDGIVAFTKYLPICKEDDIDDFNLVHVEDFDSTKQKIKDVEVCIGKEFEEFCRFMDSKFSRIVNQVAVVDFHSITCTASMTDEIEIQCEKEIVYIIGKKGIYLKYLTAETHNLEMYYALTGHYELFTITLNSRDFFYFPFEQFALRLLKKKIDGVFHGFDNIELPNNLQVNEQYKRITDSISVDDKNLVILGEAGTSKSTLVSYLRKIVNKKIIVLAPTGRAAINIMGQTIHSFFELPPRHINEEDFENHYRPKFKNIELLLIDEVSMLRIDVMEAVNKILKMNNMGYLPFGGVQVVLIGDPFQLPPVIQHEEQRQFINERYGSEWFFENEELNERFFEFHKLIQNFRQSDEEFLNILRAIRTGEINQKQLNTLNTRANVNYSGDDPIITLAPTNFLVDAINSFKLGEIQKTQFIYQGIIDGDFPENSLPNSKTLELKVGAQVILIKNDRWKRWINGTLAEISRLSIDSIFVKIGKNEYEIEKDVWKNYKYEPDDEQDDLLLL
jgi:ATP-dependent DNA helicase PIF1